MIGSSALIVPECVCEVLAPGVEAEQSGTVYWITGLPGAGKTTLSDSLTRRLRREGRHAFQVDGDRMRAVLGDRFGYGEADRRALARIYGSLCGELSGQGFDVVCATVSLFHEAHQWNRANIARYREIYLRTPLSVVRRRHPKRLYDVSREDAPQPIPGLDFSIEPPEAADLVIDDDGTRSAADVAAELFRFLDADREAA